MKTNIYGHRGARGLYPENTLIGFEKALEMPLQGIELDIVASKDRQLVISHEPWMKHETCADPDGKPISMADELEHNIYRMDYSEILGYDCGQQRNSRFPFQQLIPAKMPLLSEFMTLLEQNRNPEYVMLLEIKSDPEWYSKFQPKPDDYARLIVDFLDSHPYNGRLLIQSFDPELLNAINRIKQYSHVGLLVENELTIEENLALLDFKPTHYNLYHALVNEEIVNELSDQNLQINTWTVNSKKERDRLLELGVNNIITDYPDLFL
ncbi:MAG: glycerophosphoryl diester phosphodiesterase [Crocinitomicaceae bacterium]|jgi:glycerophosphoryl diester phosphodiesterase